MTAWTFVWSDDRGDPQTLPVRNVEASLGHSPLPREGRYLANGSCAPPDRLQLALAILERLRAGPVDRDELVRKVTETGVASERQTLNAIASMRKAGDLEVVRRPVRQGDKTRAPAIVRRVKKP